MGRMFPVHSEQSRILFDSCEICQLSGGGWRGGYQGEGTDWRTVVEWILSGRVDGGCEERVGISKAAAVTATADTSGAGADAVG